MAESLLEREESSAARNSILANERLKGRQRQFS
jgi:hypothetical protein